MADVSEFILFPKSGFIPSAVSGDAAAIQALPHIQGKEKKQKAHIEIAGKRHPIHVLDSVSETGPKLILMNRHVVEALSGKDVDGNFKIYEQRIYHPAAVGLRTAQAPSAEEPGDGLELEELTFTITDSVTGAPVEGVRILAYLDYANKKGSPPVTTDAQGQGKIVWAKQFPVIQQLWIYPPVTETYWGAYQLNVAAQSETNIAIDPVTPDYVDCVRALFPKPGFDPKSGVVVGVVDTGVDQHSGLNLAGGLNVVSGEEPGDYGSNGDPHGTHVAGLSGAFGALNGTAPGVALRSYRVFGQDKSGATSFDIAKGIYAAVNDKCDVINLSLGVQQNDSIVKKVIEHARSAGALTIAAGDNDYGGALGYPAAYPNCVAVTAMGRLGTIPDGSLPESDITDDLGSDPKNYLAAFTSVGTEVDFIGPGVGAISTVPGNTYGQMSGTSMACPVVSGCMAVLLAKNPDILNAARNGKRASAMEELLTSSTNSLGFMPAQQGSGLPSE